MGKVERTRIKICGITREADLDAVMAIEQRAYPFPWTRGIFRDCLLAGQVGIGGSTRIGDRVVLGGKCGVSDNIFVGDDVIAGGGTNIYTNVPAGRVVLGSPATKMDTQVEIQKAMRRLPRLVAQVAELRKIVTGTSEKD